MGCKYFVAAMIALGALAGTPAMADDAAKASTSDVISVRPAESVMTRQKLPGFVGVSEKTTGAKGLSMNLIVIPPGGQAEAHTHQGFESAVYLLKGKVKTLYGPDLKKSVINEAGDFLFIPPDVPHQPINLSTTEEAVAIVSRNDPREQEHVVLYQPKQ